MSPHASLIAFSSQIPLTPATNVPSAAPPVNPDSATFTLVDFAWLFFRADSVGSALEILNKILLHPEIGRTIFENLMLAGVEIKKGGVLIFELLLLFIVDFYHEKKGQISNLLDAQNKWFRWFVYITMAMFIIVGIIRDYGGSASTFIYANF